jgi:excisionase family DNA binding protein
MDEKFYTPKEIAKNLKVTYMTVYRWIRSGKLPAVKAGKQYRIKKSQFNKFLESSKYREKTNDK